MTGATVRSTPLKFARAKINSAFIRPLPLDYHNFYVTDYMLTIRFRQDNLYSKPDTLAAAPCIAALASSTTRLGGWFARPALTAMDTNWGLRNSHTRNRNASG